MQQDNNVNESTNLSNAVLKKIPQSREKIIKWMTGEYKGIWKEQNDISYEMWVDKDNNIKMLCKEFELSENKIKQEIIERHDSCCELKLLKCITEDQAHISRLYSLPEQVNCVSGLLPYQFNTVYFSSPENKEHSMNASFIDGPFDYNNKLFIATQNSLNQTINNFWQMILYNNVKLIIKLSSSFEELQNKGVSYWPREMNSSLTIGDIEIELKETSTQINLKSLIKNQFKLKDKKNNKETIVTQFIVNCWEEQSVLRPDLETNILRVLFNKIEECSLASPCLVNCNDGIGRTGVFIALFNIYKCLIEQHKNKMDPLLINIFNIVRCLREQRFGMIKELIHYQYLYNFAINLIQKIEERQYDS